MAFVKHFESYGTLACGCNTSFITLVPKIKDPNMLSDYRPISLIDCLYKIMAKILASLLKTMIGDVIGDVQFANVEGRNILDGPLIINEIYYWAKKVKECAIIQGRFQQGF